MTDAEYFAPYVEACKHMSAILAASHFEGCEFVFAPEDCHMPRYICDNRGNEIFGNDWYVVVTCRNSYKYYINVTHDSVLAMCAEVMRFISCK